MLSALSYLDLSGNRLTTLPPAICQLANLEEVMLAGNPLTSPPLEIAEQGLAAIRQYFASR